MADVTIESVEKNQARVDRLVEEKDKQKLKNTAGGGLMPREHASRNAIPYRNEQGIEEVVTTGVTRPDSVEVIDTLIENDETKLTQFKEKGRFNIDKLRYNFDQGARPNRYTVDFYCPPLGIALEGLRCQTASLPGRQLETGDFSEYGPTRKLQEKADYEFSFDADFQVESYLRHQGSAFVERFDANSILYITRAMDYFDLSKHFKGGLIEAFKNQKTKFLVISFSSDWLYTTKENKDIVIALNASGVDVSFSEINTDKGHDSFLVNEPEFLKTLKGYIDSMHIKFKDEKRI